MAAPGPLGRSAGWAVRIQPASRFLQVPMPVPAPTKRNQECIPVNKKALRSQSPGRLDWLSPGRGTKGLCTSSLSHGLKGPLGEDGEGNQPRRVRDLPVVSRHVSTEVESTPTSHPPHTSIPLPACYFWNASPAPHQISELLFQEGTWSSPSVWPPQPLTSGSNYRLLCTSVCQLDPKLHWQGLVIRWAVAIFKIKIGTCAPTRIYFCCVPHLSEV
ncbi:uncharacterized protein LOC111092251 [Canis lupus familiaris]|uniref:uncharacterized protein LOC111092251 n=1 Tax=Canis lupus familiaris TaxID=9615 RepID=UPI0018F348A9|nr:uncharacterized protein LOC111092251 [Canis lupus familiaris]